MRFQKSSCCVDVEPRLQRAWNVNYWAEIIENEVIKVHFPRYNLNGKLYLNFLPGELSVQNLGTQVVPYRMRVNLISGTQFCMQQ